MTTVDLTLDVTEAAGLDEPAHVRVSVSMPDSIVDDPIVVFARPGAGYTKGYFSEVLPGRSCSQAEWHRDRGWIFVAIDPLGTGSSSANDPAHLTYAPLVDSGHATDLEVLDRLAQGTLALDLPPISTPTVLGLGQSLGACLTIVQQAHHRTFDGIAVLGYSARRTEAPVPPGEARFAMPWSLRHESPARVVLNAPELEAEESHTADDVHPALRWLAWGMYGDDIDPETFDRPERWTTPVYLAVVDSVTTPGVIAQEAAAVRVPVLVAAGDRDVIGDLRAEVFAYQSTSDIDLFTCPRTAHMHNFSINAELLWARIHHWGEHVREQRRISRQR